MLTKTVVPDSFDWNPIGATTPHFLKTLVEKIEEISSIFSLPDEKRKKDKVTKLFLFLSISTSIKIFKFFSSFEGWERKKMAFFLRLNLTLSHPPFEEKKKDDFFLLLYVGLLLFRLFRLKKAIWSRKEGVIFDQSPETCKIK